jgi:RHS repeat-associated protein
VRGLDTVALLEGGARFYYHHDRLGSVTALTSASGASEWLYGYEPFGSPRTTSRPDPAAPVNPLGFTGQYQDPGSGLLNLRARQYDEASGRFQSTDPLPSSAVEPFEGAYVYAADSPLSGSDISGERCWTCVLKHVGSALTAGLGSDRRFLKWYAQSQLGWNSACVRSSGCFATAEAATLLLFWPGGGLGGRFAFRTTTKWARITQLLEKYHGIDPVTASKRLHEIKASAGLRGGDDVVFDLTGNVYGQSGDRIGSLTEGGKARK